MSETPMVDADRSKTLQVRVDAACAERFSAVAAAMGISPGELLRRAVDGILAEAEEQIDALGNQAHKQMRARRTELEF